MLPESQHHLRDMLRHALRTQKFATGKTVEDFVNDELLVDGISMNFVALGEALHQIEKIDLPTAERISEWRRIVGFRHQLVHGYSAIDDEITWKIIQDKLPILVSELNHLLSEK